MINDFFDQLVFYLSYLVDRIKAGYWIKRYDFVLCAMQTLHNHLWLLCTSFSRWSDSQRPSSWSSTQEDSRYRVVSQRTPSTRPSASRSGPPSTSTRCLVFRWVWEN